MEGNHWTWALEAGLMIARSLLFYPLLYSFVQSLTKNIMFYCSKCTFLFWVIFFWWHVRIRNILFKLRLNNFEMVKQKNYYEKVISKPCLNAKIVWIDLFYSGDNFVLEKDRKKINVFNPTSHLSKIFTI